MTKRKIFLQTYRYGNKKSRGLLTKINTHCLLWLNFMAFQ